MRRGVPVCVMVECNWNSGVGHCAKDWGCEDAGAGMEMTEMRKTRKLVPESARLQGQNMLLEAAA